MKLQKYVNVEHGVDNYLLTIGHAEADNAFAKMSDGEKQMVADMQHSKDVLVVLRALLFWVQKIEESKW